MKIAEYLSNIHLTILGQALPAYYVHVITSDILRKEMMGKNDMGFNM